MTEINLHIGDKVEVEVQSILNSGEGVGRFNGIAVFVPYVCVGEVVEVMIEAVEKNFARGALQNILKPSKDRTLAKCSHFQKCNACKLSHMNYKAQLAVKEVFVKDALTRIGKIENPKIESIIGSKDEYNYRNKGEFRVQKAGDGKTIFGMADAKGDFIRTADCQLQHPQIIDILNEIEALSVDFNISLAQCVIKINDNNEALVILTAWKGTDKQDIVSAAEKIGNGIEQVKGVLYNFVRSKNIALKTPIELIFGSSFLNYKLNNISYRVSAESFFQVNFSSAEQLLNTVVDFAGEDLSEKITLDAYSGVGTFLVPLAEKSAATIAIEDSVSAVDDANSNLAQYGIDGVKVYNNRVEPILARLNKKGRSSDIMVLDPPRKGIGAQCILEIAEMSPKKIIMVSCDPTTLARDLKELLPHGYKITKIQPIDMFPQTVHVETVVLLNKI